MKRTIQWITVTVALALAGLGLTAQGQTIFVAADGTNDVAGNFDTWAGSATNIHEAVDLANSLGRNVMVSNGVYRLTNELAVSTGITVQSLNGPDETTIYRDATYGNFRIFNVSHADALVSGFTVTPHTATSAFSTCRMPMRWCRVLP